MMYYDNIWALEQPGITSHHLTNMMMFNEHLFDLSRRHQSASHIRFLDFPIHLSQFMTRYLTGKEALSLRDAGQPLADNESLSRAYFFLTEATECERHQSILSYLASVHRDVFPQLQSITISLNWHALRVVGQDSNCHCLKFLVRLHRQITPPSDDSSSMSDIGNVGPYEQRRQLLTPLIHFNNLQNIEVQLQANPNQATVTDISSTENGSNALRNDAPSNDAPSDDASSDDASSDSTSSDSASSDSASSDSTSSDDASSKETSSSEAPQKEAPSKKPPKEHPVWTFSTVEQMLNAAGVNFHNFISS